MERIDRLLVDKGLVASRSRAQQLIAAGRVKVKTGLVWDAPKKTGQKYPHTAEIHIEQDESDCFVSRGGLKLAGALSRTSIDVDGLTVLDVGQSTGGFTDCVLQAGAQKVVGIEVGHGQLVEALRSDERVVCLEGVNARELPYDELQGYTSGSGFDLAVMDVSFISQTKILPSLVPLLKQGGSLVSLVKPQFEVGSAGLGKGGIVRDEALYPQVRKDVTAVCDHLGLSVKDWFDSPIKGGDGNREFFVWAVRS